MSFTCPRCSMTSHHPMDEDYGYCGNCHDFTGTPKKAPSATDSSEAELQFWFDMHQASDQMALAQWRAAHPGSELMIPDHADLVIWLLDQLAGINRIERTPAGMIDWKMEAERANRLLDSWERCDRVDQSLAKRVGKMIEKDSALMVWLNQWLRCYALDIFPEPDLAKAAEVLKANGMTIDSLSAEMGRHVLTRVIEFIKNADPSPPL
jgi:hypothetical protein